MLNFLENFEPQKRRELLADAALSTSAIPLVENAPEVTSKSEDVDALISSVRHQLKLSEQDDSESAKLRVNEFLSNELMQMLLSNVDQKQVIERLGNAGRLQPAEYSIQSTSNMRLFYKLAVRPGHVENAIKSPDKYQAIFSNDSAIAGRGHACLFVKYIARKSNEGNFVLLVQTLTQGSVQLPQAAWRIYWTDLDVNAEVSQPIDLLRSFVSRFGLPFKVNGKEFTFLETSNFALGTEVKIESRRARDIFLSWSSVSQEKIFTLGIVYCVQLARYAESLRMHGVTELPDFLAPTPTRGLAFAEAM